MFEAQKLSISWRFFKRSNANQQLINIPARTSQLIKQTVKADTKITFFIAS